MSVDFIKERIGSNSLAKAVKQQNQLLYFTQSSTQEDITTEYLEQWANRNYASNDYFLTWVKNVFKQDNFLAFFKYMRNPLPSARLVNDKIRPQLERVFHADDSFFNYVIKGEDVEEPESIKAKEFNKLMFDNLLYYFNDIIVTDLKDVNTPFSYKLGIKNVVAIQSDRSEIKRIAFGAKGLVVRDGIEVEVKGYLYIDDEAYILYDTDYNPVNVVPHDLGRCPCDYVAAESFGEDDVVRKSIFSYTRESLEEFVFLSTLLKMTEPNGAIPVATILGSQDKGDNPDTKKRRGEPNSDRVMGSQRAEFQTEVHGNTGGGALTAGTIHTIQPNLKDDGTIDTNIVQNFIKFFYTPIEALTYIKERIEEIQKSILDDVIGTISNQNNTAQNELQVQSGFETAKDKLRSFSLQFSRIRTRTDYNKLALEFGKDNVSNQAFYGSDFFLESLEMLFAQFKEAPNPIERRNVLTRTSRNRNKFNKSNAQRESILYDLLPYISDGDLETAITSQQVSPEVLQLQTRFNYWIGVFEAQYGDILVFWMALGDISNANKLTIINNLILQDVNKAIVPPPPTTAEQT